VFGSHAAQQMRSTCREKLPWLTAPGTRAINNTVDIGVGAPGNFTGALDGAIGPFLTAATGLSKVGTEQFIGDPNILQFERHPVEDFRCRLPALQGDQTMACGMRNPRGRAVIQESLPQHNSPRSIHVNSRAFDQRMDSSRALRLQARSNCSKKSKPHQATPDGVSGA
jgi:hypothetical protein